MHMESNGFNVVRCSEEFDSEVLTVVARTKKEPTPLPKAMADAKSKIDDMLSQNLRICGWGVAGNGTAFLDYLKIDKNSIKFIVDSDIRKQGMYLPATGQLVVDPGYFLEKEAPDVFLLFSQFHLSDIKNQIDKLYPNAQLITIETLCG